MRLLIICMHAPLRRTFWFHMKLGRLVHKASHRFCKLHRTGWQKIQDLHPPLCYNWKQRDGTWWATKWTDKPDNSRYSSVNSRKPFAWKNNPVVSLNFIYNLVRHITLQMAVHLLNLSVCSKCWWGTSTALSQNADLFRKFSWTLLIVGFVALNFEKRSRIVLHSAKQALASRMKAACSSRFF